MSDENETCKCECFIHCVGYIVDTDMTNGLNEAERKCRGTQAKRKTITSHRSILVISRSPLASAVLICYQISNAQTGQRARAAKYQQNSESESYTTQTSLCDYRTVFRWSIHFII